jgi:hypothetical protein
MDSAMLSPRNPCCEDQNLVENGVVRASTPDELDYSIFCRVLYSAGAPTYWLGGNLYSEGSIGHQAVLDLGVVQAVDVFNPDGTTHYQGVVEICLKGAGPTIFMAASGAPRVPVPVGNYSTDAFPGYVCVTLTEPGTLVLVEQNPVE